MTVIFYFIVVDHNWLELTGLSVQYGITTSLLVLKILRYFEILCEKKFSHSTTQHLLINLQPFKSLSAARLK